MFNCNMIVAAPQKSMNEKPTFNFGMRIDVDQSYTPAKTIVLNSAYVQRLVTTPRANRFGRFRRRGSLWRQVQIMSSVDVRFGSKADIARCQADVRAV